jgi:hypothetical protein
MLAPSCFHRTFTHSPMGAGWSSGWMVVLILTVLGSRWCWGAEALPQISYDGLEARDYTVSLERIDEKDGKPILLFHLMGGQGGYVYVRPGEKLEGYTVLMDRNVGGPGVSLLPPFPNPRPLVVERNDFLPGVLVHSYRGHFSLIDRGDVSVVAYVGERVSLDGITREIRSLEPLRAVLVDAGTGSQKVIPLSAIARLREENRKMRGELLWGEVYRNGFSITMVAIFSMVFFNLILVYAAILVGLLTLEKHPVSRRARTPSAKAGTRLVEIRP